MKTSTRTQISGRRSRRRSKGSDKGGRPGQWSARKSQLLTQEYERRGGGYKDDKDESQKNLERWTEEEWQTQEGDAQARGDDGETKRYLPKKAWEEMSEEEKRETENRKREGSRQGQQHVANTEKAKQARKGSQAPPIKDYDDLSVDEVEKKVKRLSKVGDPGGPRLREAAQEPQDPHRVDEPQDLVGDTLNLEREVGFY